MGVLGCVCVVCVCGGLGARVRLGSFLGALGHLFGCLGRFLGSSWAPPRLSWAPPGRSCAPFGLSCSVLGRLGAVLGGVGAILGRLGAILGCLVAVLGRLQTIGAQAKQARQATQSKTSIGGRWGGVGEGRKLEAATNPHSLVSLEGAGGEVELNILKPKGEFYR